MLWQLVGRHMWGAPWPYLIIPPTQKANSTQKNDRRVGPAATPVWRRGPLARVVAVGGRGSGCSRPTRATAGCVCCQDLLVRPRAKARSCVCPSRVKHMFATLRVFVWPCPTNPPTAPAGLVCRDPHRPWPLPHPSACTFVVAGSWGTTDGQRIPACVPVGDSVPSSPGV